MKNFTVSDVITSETLNLRKKYSLGKIGRKETRHNLISKSDNLVLVPAKPQLESLESLEEEEVEDTEVSRKIISEKSLSFNSLQRDFQLGSAFINEYFYKVISSIIRDVLDYVKTGMGSIIEDDVTNRYFSMMQVLIQSITLL